MNGYVKVYDWMKILPPVERLVFAEVSRFNSDKNYMSNEEIADAINISYKLARNAILKLEELGVINVKYVAGKQREITINYGVFNKDDFAEKVKSIFTKKQNQFCQKDKINFTEKSKSILPNGQNLPIYNNNTKKGVKNALHAREEPPETFSQESEDLVSLDELYYGYVLQGFKDSFTELFGVEYQPYFATLKDDTTTLQNHFVNACEHWHVEPTPERARSFFTTLYKKTEQFHQKNWDLHYLAKNINKIIKVLYEREQQASGVHFDF